ncbi:bacterioferritin [Insolitispirillum peregrinum]|uniref:Bacterioferritin n=1 Tax=Insolitispirillum peregrinum TaxID=80876 RepID=A0A1N7IMC2_9PROT|nr:bacterioferritin [Insolitispirillum peregrinum]SIS38202.1 bacterioferritin [Insolitispirillum peregrinum]
MQGKQIIIDRLNTLLAGELSAADQYFVHAHMYEDWGLNKLYERIKHEQQDELEHCQELIKRILFLGGVPDLVTRDAIHVGHDVPSMLQSDLNVEISVVAALKDAIALCEREQDYQTREILLKMLEDTEIDHGYWLEKQLGLIEKIGLQNYQQSMMGSAG